MRCSWEGASTDHIIGPVMLLFSSEETLPGCPSFPPTPPSPFPLRAAKEACRGSRLTHKFVLIKACPVQQSAGLSVDGIWQVRDLQVNDRRKMKMPQEMRIPMLWRRGMETCLVCEDKMKAWWLVHALLWRPVLLGDMAVSEAIYSSVYSVDS